MVPRVANVICTAFEGARHELLTRNRLWSPLRTSRRVIPIVQVQSVFDMAPVAREGDWTKRTPRPCAGSEPERRGEASGVVPTHVELISGAVL